MKRTVNKKRLLFFKAAIFLLSVICLCLFPSAFRGGEVVASAYGDVIKIEKYNAELTVQTDRKVVVREQITVTFLSSGLTMFYRSLPTDNAQYSNVSASCDAANTEFSYEVADNPDLEGFIDINCIGGAKRNNTWTYDIRYTMEGNYDTGDMMSIDVIPFGFTVPLHDVSVTVRFPDAITEADYATYVGFDSTKKNPSSLTRELSADGKTLTLSTDLLSVHYNSVYSERVADGITLDFTLKAGVMKSFASTRISTKEIGWLIVGGVVVTALAVVALLLTRKKRDIVNVVNIKAPDDMDPMRMGKLLDGTVDREDITSMIYYFAYKGYLEIDLSNEDDPLLIQKVESLPDGCAAYERTIFYGLFQFADRETVVSDDPFVPDSARVSIHTSELSESFYTSADKAIKQVPSVTMYEKSSLFGYISGGLIGLLFSFIACFCMGRTVSSTYTYALGGAFFVPAALILAIGYLRENYRYKWNKPKLVGVALIQLLIAILYTALVVVAFARHFMTGYEKAVVCVFSFAALFVTLPAISRTQKYVDTLGEILGFKDFIVVTEEDKIKFMLEEDPQLFYKVLPYAQVLGVTKEWTDKFANLVVEPPQWCHGANMTLFDYWLINRCMTRAMVLALTRPRNFGGGSFIGRSGGGGGFGGFGGGGFGGGGGGAR